TDLKAFAADMSEILTSNGSNEIAGAIGIMMLEDHPLQLDFARNKITVDNPNSHHDPPKSAFRIPLIMRGGLFYVRVSVSGKVGIPVLLDTGSPNTSLPASMF